jgi:hypothetical protein
MYVAQKSVGMFIRAPRNGSADSAAEQLVPHAAVLSALLGTEMATGAPDYWFSSFKKADTSDREIWPALFEWLHATADRYSKALSDVFQTTEPSIDAPREFEVPSEEHVEARG